MDTSNIKETITKILTWDRADKIGVKNFIDKNDLDLKIIKSCNEEVYEITLELKNFEKENYSLKPGQYLYFDSELGLLKLVLRYFTTYFKKN